jgi:hypothetical protein
VAWTRREAAGREQEGGSALAGRGALPDTADPGDSPRRTLPRDRFAAGPYGLLTGEADGAAPDPPLCGTLGTLLAEAQPAVMYTLVEVPAVCC